MQALLKEARLRLARSGAGATARRPEPSTCPARFQPQRLSAPPKKLGVQGQPDFQTGKGAVRQDLLIGCQKSTAPPKKYITPGAAERSGRQLKGKEASVPFISRLPEKYWRCLCPVLFIKPRQYL